MKRIIAPNSLSREEIMALEALLRETSRPFHQAVRAESEVRDRYLGLDEETESLCNGVEQADLLNRSAVLLELMWVSACAFETVHSAIHDRSVGVDRASVLAKTRRLTHLDLRRLREDASLVLGIELKSRHDVPTVTMHGAIRAVRSLLEACPIERLELMASEKDTVAIGYRCRRAYEGLRSFLVRVDPNRRESLRVLGEAYMDGKMEVREIATVLEISVPDAVSALEQAGYTRPLEAITLTDAQRKVMLRRIRVDRLERDGELEYDPSAAERDLVASARIEGLDARGRG